MAHTTILPLLTAESGLTRYLEEIRRHCHVNRKFADQMTMAVTVHAAMVAWRHVSMA